MNRERILQLADEIEAMPHDNHDFHAGGSGWIMSGTQPTSFTMEVFGCGTAACIGGHAAYRQRQEDPGAWHANGLSEMASLWLGIDPSLGDKLYYPHLHGYGRITPRQAAKVLRHLAETGEVDWSIIE